MMLLLSGTRALNMEQVIDADYSPAHIGENGFHYSAKLAITTTAVKLDIAEYDYSTFHAVGGVNQVIVLTGDEADAAWDCIKYDYVKSRCFIPSNRESA